jgi:hypothetical protein
VLGAGVDAGQRDHRLGVDHQDLVDPPAGQYLQQERAQRLWVAAPGDLARLAVDDHGLGLIAAQREDVQVADDPAKRLGIDEVARAGPPIAANELARAPQTRVRV